MSATLKNPEFPYGEIKLTILSDDFLPAERFRILWKNSDLTQKYQFPSVNEISINNNTNITSRSG